MSSHHHHAGEKDGDLTLLLDSAERVGITPFHERLGDSRALRSVERPSVLQMNITYACNLQCTHCFLECEPDSPEQMSRSVMESCLRAFEAGGFETFDITGGSPELHPDFEWLLHEASALGNVLVRTNLTLLGTERYAQLLEVLAGTEPRIIASLPSPVAPGTDDQRGVGVFERVIDVMRELNGIGYGIEPNKVLDLAHTVDGPRLPEPQERLQEEYERILTQELGIRFHEVLAFNNFPLGRFADVLVESGELDSYQQLLAESFNAETLPHMMCLDQVSVDYDGRLYDCEANHAVGLPIQLDGRDATIHDIETRPIGSRRIITNPVCYSCTAGSGSS